MKTFAIVRDAGPAQPAPGTARRSLPATLRTAIAPGRFAVLLAALCFAAPLAEARNFRLNVVADPAQIEPITMSELVATRVIRNMYEGFTDVTADGKIVRVLAESWDPIDDGKGFRFHLRKGVKFHSGRPFTAKDVKYTLEAILAPGSKGGLSAPYLANIKGAADVKAGSAKELAGVAVIDDSTVDVHFTKPEVLFPIYPIFFIDSGIVAQAGADWPAKMSAGTGPYKFKQWTRGVSVDLDANPDYWGGAPKISGVSFMIVPDGDTALAQYDAGELDFVDVQEKQFRRVLRDERYKDELIQVPRSQARYFGMNQNLYAPFKDKRVREAVALAVDGAAVIKGLYGGAAFPANGFVAPGVFGYEATLPALKYDPEQARKLMAEAGYPGGKGLPPIEIATTDAFKDEATYYADQFSRVLGMPATPKIVERATHIKAMNAGEVAFFPWSWTADYADAMSFLGDMWYSSSPYNRPRWKNAEYDKLIDEARVTSDDTKRAALYHQADRLLLADWGAVPLPTTAVLALRKPAVKNVTITPFGFSTFKDIVIQ